VIGWWDRCNNSRSFDLSAEAIHLGAEAKLQAEVRASARTGKKGHEKENEFFKLKSGSRKKVTTRRQAVAIALNEARKSGAKIPKKNTRI
jgi:hypothetical protein